MNKFLRKIQSKLKQRPQLVVAVSIFLSVLLIYLITLYPTVATEDSGELITAAYTLDIGHPPGYPLYLLLGKLFTLIIPFGNIAWRINIMSAVFGALTVMMLYLLLQKISQKEKSASSIIAVAVSLLFAFTNAFWSQAIRAEVYTLHSFLITIILYTSYLWTQQKQKTSYLYFTLFLLALGLTNHHLMAMAIPPFLVLVLATNWRLILKPIFYLKSILVTIIGLSVYLYLPIRTTYGGPYINPAMVTHHKLDAFNHIWNFVNRKIYGGTVSQVSSTPVPPSGDSSIIEATTSVFSSFLNIIITVSDTFFTKIKSIFIWPIEKVLFVANQFLAEYYYFPTILFLLALIVWLKRHKPFDLFLVFLLIFSTYILASFLAIQPTSPPIFVTQAKPFYLPALIIIAIGIWQGANILISKFPNKNAVRLAVLAIIIVLPVILFIKNIESNYQRDNYLAYDFNRALLHSLPQDAVLASSGRDNITFPLYYLQAVEKFRPEADVKIIYATNATASTIQRIALEKGTREVYSDILLPDYHQNGFVPYGMLYKFINPRIEIQVNDCLSELSRQKQPTEIISDWSCFPREKYQPISTYNFRGATKAKLDLYNESVLGLIRTKEALNAEADGNIVQRDQILNQLVQQLDDNNEIITWVGDFYQDHGLYQQALVAYEKSLIIWPNDQKTATKIAAVKRRLNLK